MNTPLTPTTKPIRGLKARLRGVDIPLLITVVTLLAFGLLMVYSASWKYSIQMGQTYTYMFTRQLMWAVVGIAIAIGISLIDYHRYRRLVLPMMYIILLLLILMLFWL